MRAGERSQTETEKQSRAAVGKVEAGNVSAVVASLAEQKADPFRAAGERAGECHGLPAAGGTDGIVRRRQCRVSQPGDNRRRGATRPIASEAAGRAGRGRGNRGGVIKRLVSTQARKTAAA